MDDSPRFVKNSLANTMKITDFADIDVTFSQWLSSGFLDIRLRNGDNDDLEYLWMSMKLYLINNCSFEYAVCVKNESVERWHKWQGYQERFVGGLFEFDGVIRMDTILDPSSGFLKDGTLEVQVEIRVDVIIGVGGEQLLNFYDPFEGCVTFVMVDDPRQLHLYASKRMLMFHSPVLAELITGGATEIALSGNWGPSFNLFLQILHGAGTLGCLFIKSVLRIIRIAFKLQVSTVMRQCEEYCQRMSERMLPQAMRISEMLSYCPHSESLLKELPESLKCQRSKIKWRGRKIDAKQLKRTLIAITRIPFNNEASWTSEPNSEPNSTSAHIDFIPKSESVTV